MYRARVSIIRDPISRGGSWRGAVVDVVVLHCDEAVTLGGPGS